MCKDCGCGLPGEQPVGYSAHNHDHPHDHEHDHDHDHDHDHGEHHAHEHSHDPDPAHGHGHPHAHTHSHPHAHGDLVHDHPHTHVHSHPTAAGAGGTEGRRSLEVHRALLEKNDRQAERNRGFFRAHGLLVLNVVSSPGSGKTTLLEKTLRAIQPALRAAVIVGDLATDNDARRLRESGAPVVQITTGTVCHLDAEMVARALRELPLDGLQLLVIENVGNLVCPASYDLGEDLRVVLLSVTEGEDKPLKYPPMFQAADVVIVSKIDLAAACDWNREALLANLRRVSPKAQVLELSSKTGQGMAAWQELLAAKHRELTRRPSLPI